MINFKNYFNDKKGFIPFVTAGDPNLLATEQFIITLIEAGATLIEIGIPFSDPIAEGKTIMEADIRALASKTTPDKIFDMVKRINTKYPTFPLVFMTYLNPVFNYGYDRFFKRCNEVGIKGIIVPDMPYEEKNEFKEIASKYDVANISLIAPTSAKRVEMIAREAEGFLYLVSSMGVTGMRDVITTDINELATEIKKYTDIPVCVGFGIKNGTQAKKMTEVADGAIIGSAIVNIIAKYGVDATPYVKEFALDVVNSINN